MQLRVSRAPLRGSVEVWLRAAAGLSLLAGLIHFAVAPEHFAEAFDEGAFMVIAGVAQVVTAFLLLRRPSTALIMLIVAGTMALFVLFGLAYTIGLPVGPHPWQPEPLGSMVVFSKATELLLLITLAEASRGWLIRGV
jgi:uncharacterized membrane protein HdeD (DUF308 family)